ncbi:MAG TPA: S8 family serine peptidase [Burkholderiales bacterium]|nr:S8 family serine peptidase [Burkholderiales bacterium]
MLRGVRIGIVDSGIAGSISTLVAADASFALNDGELVQERAATDSLGHGTALAEIVAHFVPDAALLIAQVFTRRFITTPAQVAAAIDWLVGEGAQVVNLSLGLPADRAVLAQSCRRALDAGAILCASSPARGAAVFPASYPGVLRMTGDARCAREEISWLNTAQADFGAHVIPLHGEARSGASIGCAHLTGHVARYLAQGGVPGRGAVFEWLTARASYRGPERKTQ